MRRDHWIVELRKQLPEHGVATVIVTDSEGARYLKLSASDIDEFQSKSAKSRAVAFVTLCAVIVIATCIYFWQLASEARLRHQFNAMQMDFSQYREALSNAVDGLPESVSRHEALNSVSDLHQIGAMKEIIQYQNDAFHFFVEATRPVIEELADNIFDNLQVAGVEWHLEDDFTTILPVGGTSDLDNLSSYLSYHLADPVIDAISELHEANNLLDAIPLSSPLDNARITSRFGVRRHPISRRVEPHQGVDFVSYSHPDVRVTAPGSVIFAGRDGYYGNKVAVSHDGGITTVYAHLDSIAVSLGEAVSRGDVIGIMGNTGRSTSSHLHYEIQVNGQRVDPLKFIGLEKHVHN